MNDHIALMERHPFFDEEEGPPDHDAHVVAYWVAVQGYDVWFGDGPMLDRYPTTCRACERLGYRKRVESTCPDSPPALVFGEHDIGLPAFQHRWMHFIVCGDCGSCGPWAPSQSKAVERWEAVQ